MTANVPRRIFAFFNKLPVINGGGMYDMEGKTTPKGWKILSQKTSVKLLTRRFADVFRHHESAGQKRLFFNALSGSLFYNGLALVHSTL